MNTDPYENNRSVEKGDKHSNSDNVEEDDNHKDTLKLTETTNGAVGALENEDRSDSSNKSIEYANDDFVKKNESPKSNSDGYVIVSMPDQSDVNNMTYQSSATSAECASFIETTSTENTQNAPQGLCAADDKGANLPRKLNNDNFETTETCEREPKNMYITRTSAPDSHDDVTDTTETYDNASHIQTSDTQSENKQHPTAANFETNNFPWSAAFNTTMWRVHPPRADELSHITTQQQNQHILHSDFQDVHSSYQSPRHKDEDVENMETDHDVSDTLDISSSDDHSSSQFVRLLEDTRVLKEEVDKNEALAKSFSEENKVLREKVESQECFAKRLKAENDENLTEIFKFQTENEHLKSQIKLIQSESEKKISECKKTMKELKDYYTKEINVQKKSNNDIQKNMQEMNQSFQEYIRKQDDIYKQTVENVKASWQTFFTSQQQQWTERCSSLNEEINRHKEEIDTIKAEHANLLLRYSKLAGESLAMGNPNVTDLSDSNRPTKLAEQFSELYDNDWTDAFEELTHLSEEERINLLIKILQRAYELSMEMATTDWLTRCYYTTYEDYVHTGTDTCGIENGDPHDGEEPTEIGTNDIYEAESETTSADSSVAVHGSEAVQHTKLNVLGMPDQKFDLNEREQGAVKMFAHIKKKKLSSHSQRIQKVMRNCLMKEFKVLKNDDGEATKLFDYATKCCELCLLMCVKDPPLFVEFLTDVSNQEKVTFSNEHYKAYTKKGKNIQFLVWPCLFLEKNGAMLAKGIARGGDEL